MASDVVSTWYKHSMAALALLVGLTAIALPSWKLISKDFVSYTAQVNAFICIVTGVGWVGISIWMFILVRRGRL